MSDSSNQDLDQIKNNQDSNKTEDSKPIKLEDKPFETFVTEDLIPKIETSLRNYKLYPIHINLTNDERPVVGGKCWIIRGELPMGRRFWLCFSKDTIKSQKNIALAESGSEPILLESFLIDEKKITLALIHSRLLQRLNGQKWLGTN